MKRKLLGLMLVVFVAVLPVFVNAEGKAVKIGETEYATLKDAVEAVTDSTQTTITVVADHKTSGIKFQSGKNITIDLGGHTVSFDAPTVGSNGTETQDMQILKDSTIVFKNGKFVSSNTEKSKMFIQNYANLTLKDVEIVATNEQNLYGVSNNSGDVSIEGTTSIKVKEGSVAFDVCGYHSGGYPIGPKVVVDTTGTIEGTIEVTKDLTGTVTRELSLVIKNINHVGELDIQSGLEKNVTVEAEDTDVYEIITSEGEIKYVIANDEEVEEGYFGLGFTEEGFKEVFGSQEDYEKVKGLIDEKLADKYTAAIYYELVYGNLVNNNFILGTETTELESAIKVTLDIPTTLETLKEGFNRNYSVIRVHLNEETDEYETDFLPAKDNGNGTVSFETDKFSTYVLVYEDVKNVESSKVESPDTFDSASLYIIIGGLSLIGLATVSVLLKKRNA